MHLLEIYAESKMEDASVNPEDWTLDLEDFNERMTGIYVSYTKNEAEIKIKILTGLPEECSDMITS